MTLLSIGTAENVVAAVLAVLSFTLLLISIASYRRSRNPRLALISASFLLFFIEGALFTYQLFYGSFTSQMFFTITGIINVAILLLIFTATFKR